MKTSVAVFFLAIAVASSEAVASLVITLGAASDTTTDPDPPLGPFVAGSQVTIPVFAHFDDPMLAINPVTAYSIPIDLGGDGLGIPSSGSTTFFTNLPIGVNNPNGPTSAVGGNLDFTAGLGNFDFLAEFNGSVQVSDDAALPTLLFEITFDSDTATDPGVFEITIPTDGTADSLTGVTAGAPVIDITNLLAFDNGAFVITPVPEPSSIGLASFLALLGAARSRPTRRRKPACC